MSCYNNNRHRRILASTGVRPCTDVNHVALLRSLLSLSNSLRSHAAAVAGAHRRPAAELSRQAGLLLPLLHHLPRRLPAAAVASLADLHLALQKLCCIVEDCGRDGARVWILVNCRPVAGELRRLVGEVLAALNSLPVAEVVSDVEVAEMVELLRRQAGKGRLEIDPADQSAMEVVLAALDSFRNRVAPDSTGLRRVLDHLRICSWSQCDKEIRFLEQELRLEMEEKRETEKTELLLSLLGLMSYCRGVIFHDRAEFDMKKSSCSDLVQKQEDAELVKQIGNCEDFRCPISLDLMVDPVILSTGHTYDRSSIEKWFKNGNFTCPKTGKRLGDTKLIPNLAVRSLMQRSGHGNQSVAAGSRNNRWHQMAQTNLVAVEAARMLAIFLVEKLSSESYEDRSKAVFEIRLLTQHNMLYRACLIEAGSILLLLDIITSSVPRDQNNSMACLLHLAKDGKGKAIIVETGGLDPILSMLISGVTMEGRENAAATLFYISFVDEYRELIGAMPEAVPALVGLLTSGNPRGKKYALVALYGLLLCHENHQRVRAVGVLPYLTNLLLTEHGELLDCALGVVEALAEKREGAVQILEAIDLQQLVGHLQPSTSRGGNEHCLSLLLSLCIHGGLRVVSAVRDMPAIMAPLYSLLTGGTPRARKKARALLNMLHEWSNASSPGIYCLPVREDHPVHVQ